MSEYHLPPTLAEYEAAIDRWLHGLATDSPLFEAIDRGESSESAEPRWYVRLKGEEKDHITIWLTLGQRTLRYEAYVLPAPEENAAEVYELVLRRNERLVRVGERAIVAAQCQHVAAGSRQQVQAAAKLGRRDLDGGLRARRQRR